jgi:hypothetical protein
MACNVLKSSEHFCHSDLTYKICTSQWYGSSVTCTFINSCSQNVGTVHGRELIRLERCTLIHWHYKGDLHTISHRSLLYCHLRSILRNNVFQQFPCLCCTVILGHCCKHSNNVHSHCWNAFPFCAIMIPIVAQQ